MKSQPQNEERVEKAQTLPIARTFFVPDDLSLIQKPSLAVTFLNQCRIISRGFVGIFLTFFTLTFGCSPSDWPLSTDRKMPPDELLANVKIVMPQPYRIEITGRRYQWHVRYPGIDGMLATTDDVIVGTPVHVPENTEIIFQLKSTDFVYLLSLPELHLKEIAVPGLDFSITFHPDMIGDFTMEGDDMCGDPHPEMNSRLIVESRTQFERWLRQQATTQEFPIN